MVFVIMGIVSMMIIAEWFDNIHWTRAPEPPEPEISSWHRDGGSC